MNAAALLLLVPLLARGAPQEVPGAAQEPAPPGFDASGMRAPVREVLEVARAEVLDAPEDAAAWGRYGALLDAHQLFEQAALCYSRARVLAPEDFRYPYLWAAAAELCGAAVPELVSALHRAAELSPEYLPVHVALGSVLSSDGRLEEACAAYRTALERDPDYRAAALGLGQALLALGRAKEAVPPLERAATLSPDDRATTSALARAYLLLGRRDEARVVAERARRQVVDVDERDVLRQEVAEKGTSSFAAYQRGLAALAEGRPEDAIADFETFLERRPGSPQVLASLGRAYFRAGRAKRARRRLEEALEVAPWMVDARLDLVRLLVFAHEPALDEARAHLDLVLKEDPERADALALRGAVLALAGQAAPAAESFDAVAPSHPWAVSELDLYGRVLFELERYEDAAERFRRAARMAPHEGSHAYHLGACLEHLGRLDEAIAAYREAERLDPRLPAGERAAELERQRR